MNPKTLIFFLFLQKREYPLAINWMEYINYEWSYLYKKGNIFCVTFIHVQERNMEFLMIKFVNKFGMLLPFWNDLI